MKPRSRVLLLTFQKGWTVLSFASCWGFLEIVKLLLAHPDINVNVIGEYVRQNNSYTICMLCNFLLLSIWICLLTRRLPYCFELLFCVFFQTSLTAAVHGGWCKKPEFDLSVAITELLLSYGSDVNLQDKV